MKKLIFIVFVLTVLGGCKDGFKFLSPVAKPDEEVHLADAKLLPPPPADPNADINIDAPVGNADNNSGAESIIPRTRRLAITDTSKKIIKEGTIEFETNNLSATRKEILGAVKKYGGYVDQDNETTDGDANQKQYFLKIRVPAKNFDLLADTVTATSDKVDSKNISVTDVTTQYIDIQTRLDNKKLLEKRYLDLLNKSSKISDLLDIENKLTDIRSDIESTQGQLNYLSKQVAYSSLEVTFYTKQPAQVDTGDSIGYKFKTAIVGGWQILQNLFFGLITLWPIILFIIIFYWAIKVWRKRRRAKKAAN